MREELLYHKSQLLCLFWRICMYQVKFLKWTNFFNKLNQVVKGAFCGAGSIHANFTAIKFHYGLYLQNASKACFEH